MKRLIMVLACVSLWGCASAQPRTIVTTPFGPPLLWQTYAPCGKVADVQHSTWHMTVKLCQ